MTSILDFMNSVGGSRSPQPMGGPSGSFSPTSPQMVGSQNFTPQRPPQPGGMTGKMGGPPQMGRPGMGGQTGKFGGPPQMNHTGMGLGMGDMFGYPGGPVPYIPRTKPPQPGFPPPTGKPGLGPVNPEAMNAMRPQIGSGVMPRPDPAEYSALQSASAINMQPGASYTIGGKGGYGGINPYEPNRRPV